jgi:hypothetical protein
MEDGMKKDNEMVVEVVVEVRDSADAGAGVRSRASTRSYSEGWERIFGTRQAPSKQEMN